jgi:hypothetical protein
MGDKLGIYITKLMTTVLEKDQEPFIRELALGELRRLGNNIGEFLKKNNSDDEEEPKQLEKQLLQENK